MKKLSLLLSLTLSIFYAYSQSAIVGTWKGKDGSHTVGFAFDAEGYVTFLEDKEAMGGRRYIVDGEIFYMKYELDTASKPFRIDFVMYKQKTKTEANRMRGIYELMSSTKLRITVEMGEGKRPVNFNKKEDVLILIKE